MLYSIAILGSAAWFGWWFLSSDDLSEMEAKPRIQTKTSEAPNRVLASIPILTSTEFLDKRLRHRDMPLAEPEKVPPPVVVTPVVPPPAFAGELVSTYVEDTASSSCASFRLATGMKLMRVGEEIDQQGEKFVLRSVDRRQVRLEVRGTMVEVAMKVGN